MGGQNSKPSEELIEEPIEKTVEDNNDFKVDEFYNKIGGTEKFFKLSSKIIDD